MNVAIHPEVASPELAAAFAQARIRPVPVADLLALGDLEPDGGWDLIVVELADDPALGLAFTRRAREAALGAVLVVAEPEHHQALVDAHFDDFLLTPVDPIELALRALRLTSHDPTSSDEVLLFKDLSLDLATYQARIDTTPVDLTFMEYELLRFFIANPGRVWSREQLLAQVWGYDYFGGARTVDVHVRRLRAKLGEERASWITTVRSVGYRFG